MRGVPLVVRLGGEKVRVRVSGDAELHAHLRGALGARRDPAGRGAAAVEVRWGRGGGVLRRRGQPVWRFADLRQLCLWAEWAAVSEALERIRHKSLVLHAALLARRRRGVILAGESGSGKTSLALALAIRHGYSLLADDVMVLESSGRARGIERPVRLKPGVVRAVPEAARLEAVAGLVPLRRLGGSAGPVRVGAVVLLERRRKPAATVDELGEGLAVARMSRVAWNFRDRPARSLEALARLAGKVPVAALRGGSIARRCAVVSGLLARRERA